MASRRTSAHRTGKVTSSGRPSLGITAQTVADATGTGVISVTPGGPAAKAGLQPGDIITALADQPVPSAAALQTVLATRKPGDKIPAQLTRNGTQSNVTITLGSLTSPTP